MVPPPNKVYTRLYKALLIRLICHTPIKNRVLRVNLWPFPTILMMKTSKKCHSRVPTMLLGIILTQWRHPVASSEALDFLYQAMHAVLYRFIAMAIKTASKVGILLDCCLFAHCPSGRWGNTEQVVARCRCPVASGVALNMPHWTMPSVLLQRTATTDIKTAGGWGEFVWCHCLFVCCNHSLRLSDHVMVN